MKKILIPTVASILMGGLLASSAVSTNAKTTTSAPLAKHTCEETSFIPPFMKNYTIVDCPKCGYEFGAVRGTGSNRHFYCSKCGYTYYF